MYQHDCALRNIQFFREKTAQSGVSFSFRSRRAQLDLGHVATLSYDFINLRVWSDVDPDSRYWFG
jgi:hypothetical protein